MKYYVMTLFPDMIQKGMDNSIMGKAMEKGLIELETVNIRDYAGNSYGKVDDYPYGGGAGMVLRRNRCTKPGRRSKRRQDMFPVRFT